MSVVLEARGRATNAHSISDGQGQGIPETDLQPTSRSEATPARAVAEVSLADIRHVQKLSQIPNDALVTFSFGTPHTIDAYGGTFEGCRTVSRGKIPGTDIQLPPVHFLAQREFSSLVHLAESHFSVQESGGNAGTTTRAWYDPTAKLIEVGVWGASNKSLPQKLEMSALEAKRTLALIIHEAAHGAGEGEFGAFRAEYDFLHRVGAVSEPKTHLELMLDITELYASDPTAIANAQDDFGRACKRDGCIEQDRAYWRIESERLDPKQNDFPELDEFDFPDEWERPLAVADLDLFSALS